MEHILRIFTIWFTPVKSFEAFPRGITPAQWLIPLIIILAFLGVTTYISAPYVQDMQMEMIQMNPNFPDDQRAEMMDRLSTDSLGAITFATALGGALIWYLLQTGIIFGIGTLTLGISSTFKSFWTLIVLINTTNIIELAVKVPLIISTGNLMIESGLSMLLPNYLTETFIYNFLFQFDFFSIWRVILIGLGLTIIHGTDRTKTFSILFGAWIVYALISTQLMSQYGLFMTRG